MKDIQNLLDSVKLKQKKHMFGQSLDMKHKPESDIVSMTGFVLIKGKFLTVNERWFLFL